VTDIDEDKQLASIKSTARLKAWDRAVVIHHGIPLAELTALDESQNAARIVREAQD
jgi:hypothetical protein